MITLLSMVGVVYLGMVVEPSRGEGPVSRSGASTTRAGRCRRSSTRARPGRRRPARPTPSSSSTARTSRRGRPRRARPATWKVEDGYMEVRTKAGDIRTEAGVRRLPAPRRVGHAGAGRRRRPGPRQQRRLPDGHVRGAGARLATTTRPTPTARRRRSTGSTRRWSTPAASRASGRPTTSSSTRPRFDADGKLVGPAHADGLPQRRARAEPRRADRADGAQGAAALHGARGQAAALAPGPRHPVRFRNIWIRELK